MEKNPYTPPTADLGNENPGDEMRYVGFWARVVASIVDSILTALIIIPVLNAIYGDNYWLTGVAATEASALWGVLFNYLVPAIIVLLFWVYRSATPGKMLIGARIVDITTGEKPSVPKLIGRYLGYYVSMIPLFIGFLWVAFDKRKQGWHDKLAGTAVVRK